MAWSIISSATGTNTATLGTHAAGDLILVFAYRDGSTTAPSLVSGFTNIVNGGANTNSARAAFKVAASSSETIGTWTNATSVIAVVIRNGMVGAFVQGGASSTTFNYPALTFLENDGTSGAIGFVGSRSGNNSAGAPNVEGSPSGMTNLTSVKDATDAAGCHYDLLATGWSSTNVSTGVVATGWRSIVIEILDQELPANYVGNSSVFTTEYGAVPSDVQAGYQVELPEDCTIDEIWVRSAHFDASGGGKCGFYSDSSDTPFTLIETGDEFSHNQFPAWRKSKGFTYSGSANEKIWPSVAGNDTYKIYGDTSTGIAYDKSFVAYADAFESPTSTSADRNIATVSFAMIVVYTPSAANVNVDTGLGEITYNGFAPIIQTPVNVTTGLGEVFFTGHEPSVSVNVNVQTNLGEVVYTGYEPIVNAGNNINIVTESGQILYEGYSPSISVSDNKNIQTELGQIIFEGYSPNVLATDNKNILTNSGQVFYEGFSPNIAITENINVITNVGELLFTGYSPDIVIRPEKRRFIIVT